MRPRILNTNAKYIDDSRNPMWNKMPPENRSHAKIVGLPWWTFDK